MKQIKQIIPVIMSIVGTSFGLTLSSQDYRSALEDIFNRQKQALEALHRKNTPERSAPPSTQQQTQHAEDSSLMQSLLAELVAAKDEVARLSVALAAKEREIVDLSVVQRERDGLLAQVAALQAQISGLRSAPVITSAAGIPRASEEDILRAKNTVNWRRR